MSRTGATGPRRRVRGVLPGFGLSTGFTLFYLGLVVLLPLATRGREVAPPRSP